MPSLNLAPRSVKRSVKKTAPSFKNKDGRSEVSAEEIFRQIQFKAYELYEQRGGTYGSDVDDWLEAESFIKSRLEKLSLKEK